MMLWPRVWFALVHFTLLGFAVEWIGSGNCQYHFSDQEKTWDEARQICESLGSQLLVLDTADTQAEVEVIVDKSVKAWWVGATDSDSEGQYTWIDGSSSTWTDWFLGFNSPQNDYNAQPNGGSTQNCLQIRNSFYNYPSIQTPVSRYYWNDADCTNIARFICQMRVCGLGYNAGDVCEPDAMFKQICVQENQRHLGTELDTVPDISATTCPIKCMTNPKCEVANFDSAASVCVLLSDTTSTVPAPSYSAFSTQGC